MAVIIRTHKLPKNLNVHNVYGEMQRELEKYNKDVLLDFHATTGTWKHQPKFQSDVSVLPDIVSVKVWTDDEIYGYVDKGTRPHIIRPRKPGGRLFFKVGGTPKTQPGQDTAGPGSPGTKLVAASEVHHPGTKARNFTKEIRLHHQKDFYNRIDKAIRKWARESGHSANV
jgi:hypothetical protein